MKTLDLITIGRSSVDLYGDQIGGRLEDMGSFSKYIGGSPTNIACGTARLGLKSAVITGVGDEHMGRFIREQIAREGVDTRGLSHVIIGQLLDAVGRLLEREAERLCYPVMDHATGRVEVERHLAAEEERRVEVAEHQIRVGHRRLHAAEAVGCRAGLRSGALWPDQEPAERVDARD